MPEIRAIIREKLVGFGHSGRSPGHKGVCHNILLCGSSAASAEPASPDSESIIYYIQHHKLPHHHTNAHPHYVGRTEEEAT